MRNGKPWRSWTFTYGVFTEEVWNTSSSANHQAYSYSKTVAEREACDIHGKQARWDLDTINPSLV